MTAITITCTDCGMTTDIDTCQTQSLTAVRTINAVVS